jgi:hypothetical protein
MQTARKRDTDRRQIDEKRQERGKRDKREGSPKTGDRREEEGRENPDSVLHANSPL